MVNTITEDLGIFEKYHLNPNELFIIRAFLIAQDDDDKSILFRYLALPEQVRGALREVLLQLQVKGIILKSCRIPQSGEAFQPDDIVFNKTFYKGFYKASFDLGKELFETYPMFGRINGNVVPLRGVTKHFNSLEDCFRAYGKKISWNPDKHKEVIALINWAKENTEYLQMSLASFVINMQWNELEALKNGDIANVNYEAIKML